MLWYKAWLETRWRISLMFGIILFMLFQIHLQTKSISAFTPLLRATDFMWVMNAVTLAGAGVRTDSPFRVIKGVQASMYFTLSLPVSRLRLLATRAGFGLLAMAAVIGAVCLIGASLVPELRGQIKPMDGLGYALTVFFCASSVYGISTLYATFLDQQWQMFASMFTVFGGQWLVSTIGQTGFYLFRAMGNGSPLVTHAMPWAAISVSIGICLTCLLTAWQIEKARQY